MRSALYACRQVLYNWKGIWGMAENIQCSVAEKQAPTRSICLNAWLYCWMRELLSAILGRNRPFPFNGALCVVGCHSLYDDFFGSFFVC